MPSRNGKNASEASTAPATSSLASSAFMPRCARSSRGSAGRRRCRSLRRRALDDRVRLHVLHDGPRELQVAQLGFRRCRRVTTFAAARSTSRRRALQQQSPVDRLQIELGSRSAEHVSPSPPRGRGCLVSSRAPREPFLPISGATITSANCWPTIAAAAGFVERAVERDHAAERRGRVGAVSP